MNPRDLFGVGLTIPRHENNDLHYIGEALPAPSQVVSSVDESTPSFIGGSPIPAREDHIHSFGGITLTNYYTKEEIDTMLDEIVAGDFDLTNYYTKSEVDSLLNILSTAIDDLDLRTTINESNISDLTTIVTDLDDRVTILELSSGGTVVQWLEIPFSYGTTVSPPALTVLGRYDAFKEFKITEINVTLVLASSTSYDIKIFQQLGGSGAFSLIDTVTISAGSTNQTHVLSSPIDVAGSDVLEASVDSQPTGDGEVLNVTIRGFYV